MKDRYLFRGKRIDNGEWVEGHLVRTAVGKYVNILENPDVKGEQAEVYEVDESTICQCTGLKDKNGKLIWENDICKRALLPTKRIGAFFRVVYDKPKCCLAAIDLNGWNKTFLNDYINSGYEVEVIGNVFDNPELLEV